MAGDGYTLPVATARATFEWPGQIRRDPSAVETTWLRHNLRTIHCAIEMVCVKSNAFSQRFCSSQGLRIAPSDL